MTDRPGGKRHWTSYRIVAGLVAAPLLYVLSFGPIMWLLDHYTVPGSSSRVFVLSAYKPLNLLLLHGPSWIADPLWYLMTFFCWWGP